MVELYLQVAPDSPHHRACAAMLEQVATEPCFNILRTREQLGYSVSCGLRLTHGVIGFAVYVVSGERIRARSCR